MISTERIRGQRYLDGRDEMNLADFPISVLQRQQPRAKDGMKVDSVTFESSRYDTRTRQRVQQRVVLESNARHGLPTPADENVVLALLYVAKHAHNFSEPKIHFRPRQLFRIMGWAPNSRSYERLRAVLRRLKALVIRYENAWWDMAGRSYEVETATGIIAEYELGRQVSGDKKNGVRLDCWIRWSPQFQQSLASGNLKKLDLAKLFSLRLPSAQRMYRFLDKRFYQSRTVEMDLVDFACGHIGLNRVANIAELKRRLLPAIRELEKIGYLMPVKPAERFMKVRTGVWRVRFLARTEQAEIDRASTAAGQLASACTPEKALQASESDASQLAREFYRAWDPTRLPSICENDLVRAQAILAEFESERAQALIEDLVRIVKKKWPECRTLSGAAEKYLAEAVRLLQWRENRARAQERSRQQQQRDAEQQQRFLQERRSRECKWEQMPPQQQRVIEAEVLRRHPEHRQHPAILRALCLDLVA